MHAILKSPAAALTDSTPTVVADADPARRGGTAPLAHASIAFGVIRHARLRPALNAFAYRAFYLRLPLSRVGDSLAGLRWCSHNAWNLMSFYDEDHNGGEDHVTPLAWVRGLLARAGIHDADGEVWLHAFPRVFGYVFNPVSFWFCERADGALRAIVCVVNNTFGERHCYLLDHADGRPLRQGEELTARKVFHVSPFNPVAGGYRFRFLNALATQGRSVARIDYVDDAGPVLLTSISGKHVPLDNGTVRHAMLRYPLYTLGVIVLIHWQALRLWLRRVPFHSKPQPPAEQVTR